MLLANRRLRPVIPIVIAIVAIAVGWGLSVGLSGYYVFLGISAITAIIAVIGLGVVTGSAGIIALSQLTFAAIGAWVVAWMSVNEVPGGFPVWLLAGGAAGFLAGVLLGLPALRLRGVRERHIHTHLQRCGVVQPQHRARHRGQFARVARHPRSTPVIRSPC